MRLRIAPLVVALFALLAATGRAQVTTETGRLEGARYTIAKPAAWNGRLLLIAHGLRPDAAPLDAALDTARPPWSRLLADGWIVALTSYRRNGVILRDAITDLANLRQQVALRHGQPDRVYVIGESMGGAIAARLVEHFPDDYAGAVAVGAALQVQEPEPTLGLELTPRRPLLFLTNQSEITGPREYVKQTQRAPVPPVLWRVARDGHVNVNAAEKLAALAALVRWVEQSQRPTDEADATLPPEPGPSVARFHGDGTASGRVTGVDPVYGNLLLEFQPADLARLDIEPNTRFALLAGDRLIRVFYGRGFNSVERGDWVAYPDSEGWLAVAINYGNAAANSGLKAGDTVTLRRLRGE